MVIGGTILVIYLIYKEFGRTSGGGINYSNTPENFKNEAANTKNYQYVSDNTSTDPGLNYHDSVNCVDSTYISSENIREIRKEIRYSFSSSTSTTDSPETSHLINDLRENAFKRVSQRNPHVITEDPHLKLQEIINTDVSPNTKTAAIDSVLCEIAKTENSNMTNNSSEVDSAVTVNTLPEIDDAPIHTTEIPIQDTTPTVLLDSLSKEFSSSNSSNTSLTDVENAYKVTSGQPYDLFPSYPNLFPTKPPEPSEE
jgi:hypothetical protein